VIPKVIGPRRRLSSLIPDSTRLNVPKIALNGRFSGTLEPTGTQIVAFHLFDAIVREPRDFPLVIFVDPAFPGVKDWAAIPQTEIRATPFSRWRRSRSQLWEQFILPLELRKARCTLVHHPMVTCPRWGLGTPSIVTLHDLNFYHHPEWVAPAFRRWLMLTAIPGIHRAAHVACISDYVLADARTVLKLPVEKSSRIYNGLKKSPFLPEPGETREAFRILGVNLWQPHKNLLRLLDAFAILKAEFPELELHLAGRPQAQFREQPELAARLKAPGLKILGYLSDADLARAYRTATLVAYPSLEEGFGLPILEAMAAGTPVVTSDASCLPEIAGGAAILVDPLSVGDMARGLRAALLESPTEREERVKNGKDIASRFTWQRAAKEYVRLYRQLTL
jgi:glycosyltransferase involved in cell wall biosynthesis